jgi:hypothetical protein
VRNKAVKGAGGKTAQRLVVPEAPVAKKEAGEQRNVFAAVAEGWKNEANRGEVVGKVGAKGSGRGETAERLGRAGDELQRSGCGTDTKALMRGEIEEIAEAALLIGVELIDAGEVEETAADFIPADLGTVEESCGEVRSKGAGGRWADAMEGLRGQHFAGA